MAQAAFSSGVIFHGVCSSQAQTVDAFDPHANNGVVSLAVQPDGKVILGGWFSAVNYQFHNGLARVDAGGTLDWSFPPSGVVYSIVLQPDGKVLVGGMFGDVGGVPRANIARITAGGDVDSGFNPGAGGGVNCLALQPDGKVLVGGNGTIGDSQHVYLARLNADGTLDTGFNATPSRYVETIAVQTNGQIVVGGWFTTLDGQPRNYLGRLNANGTLDTAFTNGVGGTLFPYVHCVLVQPDGKLVIGGAFSTLAGQSRTNIGRLNADGSVDATFNPNADNEVFSLTQQTDGKILVGGWFGNLGGKPCPNLGRLNPDGTLDTNFNAAVDGQVEALALQSDGKLVAGGFFNSVGGLGRSAIARLNNTGAATQSLAKQGSNMNWLRGGTSPEVWRTTFDFSSDGVNWVGLGTGTRIAGGWQVAASSLPAKSTVRARGFLQGGRYQGSGQLMEAFLGALAISQQPLSRTNPAGTLAGFNVAAGGGNATITYQWRRAGTNLADGGNISGSTTSTLLLGDVLGADATNYSVVVTSGTESLTSQVAQLKVIEPVINAQPASQWASNGQTAVFTVQATGTTPLTYQWRREGTNLPGATASSLSLTSITPASRGTYDVVVASPYGTATSTPAVLGTTDPFNPSVNGSVHCLLVQPDGRIVLGGAFTSVGGQARTNLARVNADGSLDYDFNPGADSDVYALSIQGDGKILVGGDFTNLAGQARSYLGRLNLDGTLDGTFTPIEDSMVFGLTMQTNGMILVSGWFSTLAGEPCSRFGRLHPDGTRDPSFNPSPDSAVGSIAVQADGKIVVGGAFSNVGGAARNRLARLNADGTADSSFVDPQVWNGVAAVAVQPDGKVLFGGSVNNLGGVPRNWVARVNADGTLDTSWDAGLIGGPVNSIVVQADGRILLGGSFYSVAGQARNNIVRVFNDGTLDTSFNPGANGAIECLTLQADGQVLAAGGFTVLGGDNRARLGRLNPTQPATNSLSLTGPTLTWLRGPAAPDASLTTFAASTNSTDWFDMGAGQRVAGGWQLNGVSLPANATVRARAPLVGDSHASSWYCETVIGPPVIDLQPFSVTNLAGASASFLAHAAGGPPLGFQWLKNGVPLADGGNICGAQTFRLALTNTLGGDRGAYALVASNSSGSVTSVVAYLEVVDPILTSQPTSQSAKLGQSVSFSVGAYGSQPISYQWRQNSAPIPSGTNATLTLTNLQGPEAGLYDAVVTNAFGSLTSSVVSLGINLALADSFNPGADTFVLALAEQGDGAVLAGGYFSNLAGQVHTRIGRLLPDGSGDSSFNPSANGNVWALAVQTNGQIVVAGEFTDLSGQPVYRLGRMNPDGVVDLSLQPQANNTVRALAIQADGQLLAGGYFTQIGGQNRTYLARFAPSGVIDNTFNPVLDGGVYALELQPDGNILVGGSFSTVNAAAHRGIVRLKPNGSVDDTFNATIGTTNFAAPFALLVQKDGRILVGGQFDIVNGEFRTNLARLNPDGSLDTTFRADTLDSPYPWVQSLSLQADGKILVGGLFNSVGGQSRPGIARLNPDGGVDPAYDPGEGWTWVYSQALQADGKLVLGGWFYTIGQQPRNRIARLNNLEPAANTLLFDGSSITWQRGGSATEVWRATFEYSTNGLDWVWLGAGARTADGWQLTGLNLPANAIVRARGFVSGGSWYVESLAGPPVVLSSPMSVSVYAPAPAVYFSVSGIGGQPLVYSWLKNGVPLADGGNVSGSHSSLLMLTNVLGADSGQYQAVLSNAWGSVTSLVATLTVVDPYLIAGPASQSVNAGQSATFSVNATGTIPMQYQWRLDGSPLPYATNVTLTITNAGRADAGAYTVVVSNAWGAVTSAVAALTVNLALPDAFNPGSRGAVTQVMLQPDGKILVSGLYGQPNRPKYLERFNPDGSPDPGFLYSNVVVDVSSTYCLALQTDARILGSGLGRQQLPTTLWRLNGDGTLDSGFTNQVSGAIYGLVLRPDGEAWAGGNFTLGKPAILTNLALVQTDGTVNTNIAAAINGVIFSLASQPDGKLIAGGSFTVVNGQTETRLARFTEAGVVDTNFSASADNTVYCALVQPDDRILVGGVFTTLDTSTVNRVGRLNEDGTLDTAFNPNVNGPVYSMALQVDGRIIIAGSFTAVSGLPRNRLARLNPDGSLDLTFNPNANGTVYAVGLQADGAVVVSGSFSTLAGQYRTNLARLAPIEPATQALSYDGLNLNWSRGGASPEVWRTAFEVSTNGSDWAYLGAGERVAGGWRLAGVSLSARANVRARGFVTGGQNNAASWFAESIIGPALLTSQPASRTNLAGTTATFWISAGGTAPLSYQWLKGNQPLADGDNISGAATPALTLSNVLGGDGAGYSVIVNNAGGSVTSSVARLAVIEPIITSQPVSAYTDAGQSVSFSVAAIGTTPAYQWRKNGTNIDGATGTSLLFASPQKDDIAGYSVVVSTAFGAATSSVATLTLNLALPDDLSPALNDEVRSLATQPDGKILIGGNFSHIGSDWFYEFGRLNPDGSRDTNFPGHVNSAADTVAVQPDGNVLVGGWFNYANDWPHSLICRFYPDGGLDPAVNPAIGSSTLPPFVDSLVPQPDGKFLIGGWFTSLAGQTRNYLGRFNANGTLDSFNPGANTHVMVLALQPDGKIVASGNFTTLGGQTRNRIGRLNPDGGLDTAFDPNANSTVNSVVVQPDGRILAGGSFTTIAGQTRSYLARLNPDGTLDTAFNANLNGGITGIALQTDGSVVICGGFTAVGGQARTGIARVNATGAVDPYWSPQVAGGAVGGIAIQPDAKILLGGSFTSINGLARSRLARVDAVTPAEHRLACDALGITWWRGGSSPELSGVWFESSTDGTNWTSLGTATRLAGGWRVNAASLAIDSYVRGRGFASGGRWNGSLSLVEETTRVSALTPPVILSTDPSFGVRTNRFGFKVRALAGQTVVIESTSDWQGWVPLQTNLVPAGGIVGFSDSFPGASAERFYRARVAEGASPPP